MPIAAVRRGTGIVLTKQLSDGLSLRRIDASIPDGLLQIRGHAGGIDRSGYIFVRVEEDWIVCARLTAELLDEGLPLIEQGIMASSARRRDFFLRRLLGTWASFGGQCRFLGLGVSLDCRALAAVRRSASSILHLASIASITASHTSLGRTSFCVMSSRLSGSA